MSRRPKPALSRRLTPASPRPIPPAPAALGDAGIRAWRQLWACHWLVPERHSRPVTRYCTLQDLLALALAQIEHDGFMVTGSAKQSRCHPALAEVRMLSTESRLLEIELGMTPASESKAGVPAKIEHIELLDTDADESDDPRASLSVLRAVRPDEAAAGSDG